MLRRTTISLILSVLLVMMQARAQNDDIPTIAFLRLGQVDVLEPTNTATLDMLQVYGFVNADERRLLDEKRDLNGEYLNIIWGDAGNDISNINYIVEEAIDKGADILHTTSTQVSQIAANIIVDMDDPPALFFSLVAVPYGYGLASSSCIKPAHVVGTHAPVPFDLILPVLLVQNPDMKVLGILVNPAEDLSMDSLDTIMEYGEPMGLSIEVEAVTGPVDMAFATTALVDDGAEAIMLSSSFVLLLGLPSIVSAASESGIPVFVAFPNWIDRGAVVGAGYTEYYRDGVHTAAMMIAHLNGEIEISDIGISLTPSLTVALNLDAAEEAGIELSDELLAMADWVIENGVSTKDPTPPTLPDLTLDERRAEDAAFLEALRCTPEMIAEQQAELVAAE